MVLVRLGVKTEVRGKKGKKSITFSGLQCLRAEGIIVNA